MRNLVTFLVIVLAASVARAQTALLYEGGWSLTTAQRIAYLQPGDRWLGFGAFKEYAPVSPIAMEMGREFNFLQSIVPGAKLSAHSRPDLMTLYKTNYTGRLALGVIPGTSSDRLVRYCSTRNCNGWAPNLPGFNANWILHVPRAPAEARALERFGLNPFDPATCATAWSSAVDCAAIQALATPTTVPQLYAEWNSTTNSLFIGSVVIDLRIPEARAWKIKLELATLAAYGISGTETFGVLFGPKTGWYAYEADASANYRGCRAPGDTSYAGTLWGAGKPAACPTWAGWTASPMFDSVYGPGEYEAASNAFFAEWIAALDAAHLPNVQAIVERAPPGWNEQAGREMTLQEEIPALAGSSHFAGTYQGTTP